MDLYGGHLKLESFANVHSGLLADLNEEFARLKKEGDYSQEAMKQCRVSEIVSAHTGMNVIFYVNEEIGHNALFKFPSLDNNHPFIASMGYKSWFGGEAGAALAKDGPVKGSIDVVNYKVTGIYQEIELPIMMGYQLINDRSFTPEEICEVFLHELGHGFTFLAYLGKIIRDSYIISTASRIVAGSENPEVKAKVLVRAEEQLGIEPLNYSELSGAADLIRKDNTELVLVSNSLIKGTSNSGTLDYDSRSVEQLADRFVTDHGGGRALASALVKLNKKYHTVAARSGVTYLVVELIKTVVTLLLLSGGPIATIIWLVAMIPSAKIYDDPQQRVIALRQNLTDALRQTKDKESQAHLMEQIEAVDLLTSELKDRRTFYEAIYETITPMGRRRYQQEKHQENIRNMLFNQLQAKALKMRS